MSYSSERKSYAVRLLTDKSAADLHTDRLVVLRWKGNKATGRVAHSARCVSVPMVQLSLEGKDAGFLPMLTTAVEEHQKHLIHSFVTAHLDEYRDAGEISIPADAFTLDRVLADWQEEQETTRSGNGKLAGSMIASWFDDKLADTLVLTLAERKGYGADMTEEQLAGLNKAAGNYKKMLQLLASLNPAVTVEQAKLLGKAITLLPDDVVRGDVVWSKMNSKLDGIINPKSANDLLEVL